MKIFLIFLLFAFSSLSQAQTTVWGVDGAWHNPLAGAMRVLGTLRAANMNSTADQAIAIPATITKWAPTAIWATNCTGSLTLASGGVYPSASKGGTALVAATQAYSALTGSTVVLPMTMAANIATTLQTVATVYFSLTTASGAAATCDIYILGVDLT